MSTCEQIGHNTCSKMVFFLHFALNQAPGSLVRIKQAAKLVQCVSLASADTGSSPESLHVAEHEGLYCVH